MNSEKQPNGNITSAKDVGRIVATYRKSQALTQTDLAGLGQTGTRFISDLENGKGTVQFDKVMHILDLLGLDVIIVDRNL